MESLAAWKPNEAQRQNLIYRYYKYVLKGSGRSTTNKGKPMCRKIYIDDSEQFAMLQKY